MVEGCSLRCRGHAGRSLPPAPSHTAISLIKACPCLCFFCESFYDGFLTYAGCIGLSHMRIQVHLSAQGIDEILIVQLLCYATPAALLPPLLLSP